MRKSFFGASVQKYKSVFDTDEEDPTPIPLDPSLISLKGPPKPLASARKKSPKINFLSDQSQIQGVKSIKQNCKLS